MRRALSLAVVPVVLAVAIGLMVLWPRGDEPDISRFVGVQGPLIKGEVQEALRAPCSGSQPEDDVRCQSVFVEIKSGPDDGDIIGYEEPLGAATARVTAGDDILLVYTADAPPGQQYAFADFQRDTPLTLLGFLFAASVVALGRWRGLRALLALGASLGVLVWFILPALLEGRSPVGVAIIGALTIMLVVLYVTGGVNVRTTTAVLGTAVSLGLIAALSALFAGLAHLTGQGSEEATFLSAAAGTVSLEGLVLAGIVIGALGVLDDITVTQVSAVWELHETDPALGVRRLYQAAERIGRDHIASTVNTLFLAYAGAALPALILYTQSSQSLGRILTGEIIAVELVRTLVGSVGLVASVPITTLLAAYVVTRMRAEPRELATPSQETVEGEL